MELRTERLLLRPWREEDAPDLYACASDPRIGMAADWPPHRDVGESRMVIREIFSAPETYAVVLRRTGRGVGCVGLLFGANGHVALRDDEAEVGYWIGVRYWGQGLIPEALRALIDRAFDDLHLATLWCCSFVENAQSQRVQEKCGFRYVRTENQPAADNSDCSSAVGSPTDESARAIRISRLDRLDHLERADRADRADR